MFVVIKSILCVLLCLEVWGQQLATVDMTNVVHTGVLYYYSNFGMAFDFLEIRNYLLDPLLRGYMLNSVINNFYNTRYQTVIHVPKGYKYGCESLLYPNGNITCTLDLKLNSTLISDIAYFLREAANTDGPFFGWDIEGSNFNNYNFQDNYYNQVVALYSFTELVDMGDTLANYSSAKFLSDNTLIYNNIGGQVMGPGLTQSNTDNSWFQIIKNLSSIYVYFSFRCIIFKNISDATISNLLSDTYVDQYITNRVTGLDGTYYDPWNYYIAFNDVRLTNSLGVDGVTNSFAAALWTLDFALKSAYLTINPVMFHAPLTPSYQSVFGVPPQYSPSAIYYGLLMANLAMGDKAEFLYSTVAAQLSQHIKVYTFYNNDGHALAIINKDQDVNLVGTVDVSVNYVGILRCTYMQAPSLSSTSGITIGKVSFVSNSSEFVGNFTTVNYLPSNGVFKIAVKYAQAVYCNEKSESNYKLFNRRRSASGSVWVCVCVIFYLLWVL